MAGIAGETSCNTFCCVVADDTAKYKNVPALEICSVRYKKIRYRLDHGIFMCYHTLMPL